MDIELEAHDERVAFASAWLKAHARAPVALAKGTSNLFRDRSQGAREHLDLSAMDNVLDSDAEAGWVDVEGSCTYQRLVQWTLQRGVMPAVVPQLKTITAGGAAAGVGIEATSFRMGLVHDTLHEIEVLLPGGDVVTCAPFNEHSDLFYGFPNSYGTLGYAVRLRLATLPVLPTVRVVHTRFEGAKDYFAAMVKACEGKADFVDGVVFGGGEHVLSEARFTAHAPWDSDYTWMNAYWKSVRACREDYLRTADYLWRWDTDWFWCSRNFGADHKAVRLLLGRRYLNSRTYTRMMRFASRWQIPQRLARWRGHGRESVIQDVDIPIGHAAQFLAFLHREIGILPIWVCPVRGGLPERRMRLYPLNRASLYMNFGFWDAIETPGQHRGGHFNRLVEREVIRLGGIKSLYSDSYFTRSEFDAAYGGAEYERLKAKYDPDHRAPHLFDKCVRHA